MQVDENQVLFSVLEPCPIGYAALYLYKTQVMKTIATLIFVLFIGVTAQANTADDMVKVDAIEITVTVATSSDEVSLKPTTEVARLYKRINTRVKNELTFTTKANRAKTA